MRKVLSGGILDPFCWICPSSNLTIYNVMYIAVFTYRMPNVTLSTIYITCFLEDKTLCTWHEFTFFQFWKWFAWKFWEIQPWRYLDSGRYPRSISGEVFCGNCEVIKVAGLKEEFLGLQRIGDACNCVVEFCKNCRTLGPIFFGRKNHWQKRRNQLFSVDSMWVKHRKFSYGELNKSGDGTCPRGGFYFIFCPNEMLQFCRLACSWLTTIDPQKIHQDFPKHVPQMSSPKLDRSKNIMF